MKKEIPNKGLIMVALIVSALALFNIFLFITQLDITGGASSGEGYVNVTVFTATDISISVSAINFSATNPGQSRNSYNSSDVIDCDADDHCGLNITNDGTSFINITIRETTNLFTSSNYDAAQHFTYNVTMKDPEYTTSYGGKCNCSTGYSQGHKGPDDNGQTGQWRAIPRSSAEVAICYLNNTNTPDDENRPDIAVVEINITAPTDETAGVKSGVLTFTAIAA